LGDLERLERAHPGAATLLREGLDETLTLQGLGVTGALYRTLRSTNAIENLNGLVGRFSRNVRRRDGHMLVRWIAAGLHEARRSFRRLRGHADLPPSSERSIARRSTLVRSRGTETRVCPRDRLARRS
jgi:hypothetical protein